MKQHKKGLVVWLLTVVLLFIAALLAGSSGRSETVQEAMRDAVLHDSGQISLFELKAVNPGMISAFLVTAVLLIAAVLIRIFRHPPGSSSSLENSSWCWRKRWACSTAWPREAAPPKPVYGGLHLFRRGVHLRGNAV